MANEEREKEEGLGEVSEDLMREMGENYPDAYNMPPSIPVDIAGSAPLGDAPTILSDRSRGASVRSVFDTRPINGTDFHSTDVQSVTPSLELDSEITFTYVVPDSYIAVLRTFEFVQDTIIVDTAEYISLSITINGIIQVGHSNLSVLQDTGKLNTHIIIPEKATLGMKLYYPAGFSSATTINVWGHFYGNLILSKNQPPAFEVGNDVPVKSIPVPPELGGAKSTTVQSPVKSRTQVRTQRPGRKLQFSKNSGAPSGSSRISIKIGK